MGGSATSNGSRATLFASRWGAAFPGLHELRLNCPSGCACGCAFRVVTRMGMSTGIVPTS